MAGVLYGPEIDGAALGIPADTKVNLRADFRQHLFTGLIEQKGPRLAWSRASICPCQSIDGQTRAPDPTCVLCHETPGWLFFHPEGYNATEYAEVGELDDLQQHLLTREVSPAVVIRGLITSVARSGTAVDRLGDWAWGSYNITTHPQNKLSYGDRITSLETEISYSQIVHVTTSSGPIALRFPATRVSLCRTVSTRYEPGAAFELDAVGRLDFSAGQRPPKGTRMAVHYDHHPQFIIQEHAHVMRAAVRKAKIAASALKTPQGNVQVLPVQAMGKLEFLFQS